MAQRAHRTDVGATSFMATDVGGTHARVGLVRRGADGGARITDYTTYPGADYPELADILRRFMAEHAPGVRHCVLACAGQVIDGVVVNNNLPWTVAAVPLREALDLADLAIINDFEALAWATPYIDRAKTTLLSACADGNRDGPVIVVGPGTGLGSAVYVPDAVHPRVLPTEAGQIDLAPGNEREARVLAIMAQGARYISYEHVLSGPGMLNLYKALGEYYDQRAPLDDPKDITCAAMAAEPDALAFQTLDTFCGLFGSFVGNLAMLYNASGGIYLAGGIVPHIRGFLLKSDFMPRFLAKGQTRAFLERVPIRLIQHGQLGVLGAASWYLRRLGPGQPGASGRAERLTGAGGRITLEAYR